jgi:hypothetical protein
VLIMPLPQHCDHSVYDLRAALDIHTGETDAPFPARRRSLQEIVDRAHIDAPVLERELSDIQLRLGTAAERPGDVDRASVIGHQLTNLTCLAVLMEGLEEMN